MKKKKTRIFIIEFLLVGLAVYLTRLTGIISGAGQMVNVGSVQLSSTQVIGVITSARVIIYVIIVLVNRRAGIILAPILILYGSIGMTVATIRNHIYDSIPGISMMLASLILCYIIASFMKQEEKAQAHIADISNRDTLTGLYNRRQLLAEIEKREEKKTPFYLTSINVDNFQLLSEEFGYSGADEVMAEIGDRINRIPDKSVFAAILGSSNIVIISDDKDRNELENNYEKLMLEITRPMRIQDTFVKPELVTRAVHYPEDAKDGKSLLRYLDTIRIIKDGFDSNRIMFMDDVANSKVLEELAIEERIIEALRTEEINLVFQPQYVGKNKKLRGYETLSRLTDKEGKNIPPDIFIKIAEKTNLILDVDKYVLDHALRLFRPIMKLNPDLVLSVNVSAKHFGIDGFSDMVIEILRKNSYPAWQLELEVTETAFADHLDRVKDSIEKLRKLNVKIALDDFGTGYASLSFLSQLPVDTLKIDKSFVDKLSEDGGDDFIVIIISLAKILNLETVAEGVETQEQLENLKMWGCNFIQGYLWGRPMNFDAAVALAENK